MISAGGAVWLEIPQAEACAVARVRFVALGVGGIPTAGACPKAIAELTNTSWFFNTNIVDHFALRHVKAQAQLVVKFH